MKNLEKQNNKDLINMLREKRKALRSFRFGSSGSKIKNVKGGINIRKEIAQILTEMRARELVDNNR